MYNFRLTKVEFNNGMEIEPGKLVVLVGPNNVGKSKALKEIAQTIESRSQKPKIVVRKVEWTFPQSYSQLRESYGLKSHLNENGQWGFRTLNPQLVDEFLVFGGYCHPTDHQNLATLHFAGTYGPAMVAFLTTEHRLQLIKDSPSAAHENQIANLLQVLYDREKAIEEEIRKLAKEAFGREVALDFTVPQRLRLRVGADFSKLPPDPRDAKPIMSQHELIDDQGDGIRSFVGIAVAMLSLRRSLFLIDEPEAFLHPPQAFRIGQFLARQVQSERQIVVATHSADVLRGILSRTQDVMIVRMDRVENSNSYRILDAERLKELVKDPLLSSARVLDGLFYSGAVVVEGDSDARFYHAASIKRSPNLDLHFVNADNKQTVPRITKLYRDMGVRCAGIVDFDVLNDRTEFQKQLEALELPPDKTSVALGHQAAVSKIANNISPKQRLENAKRQLADLLQAIANSENHAAPTKHEDSSTNEQILKRIEGKCRELAESSKGWNQLKRDGRTALTKEVEADFDQVSEICAVKGLFINPSGQLESMLTEYGIPTTTDKRAWITQALQLLPNLEVDDKKQPWKFLKAIHDHLTSAEAEEPSAPPAANQPGAA